MDLVLDEAIKQIDNSINLIQNKLKGFNIHGRIVLSKAKGPSLNSSEFQKLKRKIRKLNGSLEYETQKFLEKLYS